MARPLRIEYPEAWHHVMNRARKGESLFSQKEDYYLFIKLLKEITQLWNARLAAFCIMTIIIPLLSQYHPIRQCH
jgi:putative transposase